MVCGLIVFGVVRTRVRPDTVPRCESVVGMPRREVLAAVFVPQTRLKAGLWWSENSFGGVRQAVRINTVGLREP